MKKNLLAIFLFTPALIYAQAGNLDKSFGDTGFVLNKNITGILNKVALQSDGKIIGAGIGNPNSTAPFSIIRYNINGSIDSSFGTDGVAGNLQQNQVTGLTIQDNDAIIALSGYSSIVQLARYEKDGVLDNSFGTDGLVMTEIGTNITSPSDVVIQPDNKIVVGGYIINQPNQARQGFLVRYIPDGNLDKSFGVNGIVVLGEVNGDKSFGNVYAIALQTNGQILMSTSFIDGGAIYRFNTNGSIDNSFGLKGKAIFQLSDFAVKSFIAKSLVVQPDGKIVGGGSALKKQFSSTFTYMATARLNTDGSIDSSFGNNGLQHIEFGKNASDATTILLQDDSKLVLTGRTYDDDQTFSRLALTRLELNGEIDSAFGNNGQTVTEVEGSAGSTNAVLQKDKKILLGGETTIGVIGGNNYCLLARYNNDESGKKQILITKIKRWLQHHNGFTWDANSSVSSYVVQRSFDGIHFSSIAKINAGSSSNAYADPSPLNGNNYYRLQTTSVSGAVNYSNVIAVTANDNAISISPNPAKSNLQIQGLSSSNKAKLTVVDFSGNVKLQAVVNAPSYNLNIASLTTGNYMLKIETNGEVVTKKFVKE